MSIKYNLKFRIYAVSNLYELKRAKWFFPLIN